MIRFVYIGDQINEGEKAFAFFNTITDTFVECGLGDTQMFSNLTEFKNLATKEMYERCIALVPEELK